MFSFTPRIKVTWLLERGQRVGRTSGESLPHHQSVFNGARGKTVPVLHLLPFHRLLRPFLLSRAWVTVPKAAASWRSGTDAEVFEASRSLAPEVPAPAGPACESTHLWLTPRWPFSTSADHQNDFGSSQEPKRWESPREIRTAPGRGATCLQTLQSGPGGFAVHRGLSPRPPGWPCAGW